MKFIELEYQLLINIYDFFYNQLRPKFFNKKIIYLHLNINEKYHQHKFNFSGCIRSFK